jgi:hypothetical protein
MTRDGLERRFDINGRSDRSQCCVENGYSAFSDCRYRSIGSDSDCANGADSERPLRRSAIIGDRDD